MKAIRLALLQEQLEGVAEVMGEALARSAFSPNIRVRLDFSCALFSSAGELLAQAAHIPVHLGSMPDQMKALVRAYEVKPGDLFIANDPYEGGTHLPDITLIEPVFHDSGLCLGLVAARAHHADVGGQAPGSMASQPDIYGDGLRIPILRIAEDESWDRQILKLLLANMRSPKDREGDLLAQQSACQQGCRGLQRVFAQWAKDDPSSWEQGLQELLETSRRGAQEYFAAFVSDRNEAFFQDFLELGSSLVPIKVRLSRSDDGRLVVNFHGTGAAVKSGFNATLPVTKAAVCYVLRCLAPMELPLNQGFLDSFIVEAEEGSMVSAVYPQAVAAGNVETSQRLVDVVFGAFSELIPDRVPAASAGTMNNFSFGFSDPAFGVHYETSGGGAGGCPGNKGAAQSGTQVHMTNTLSTPTEILEEEFPVSVGLHSFREGSGGDGRYPGGRGFVKEVTFHAQARVSLMATRRRTKPFGLKGGGDGAPGRQALRKQDGEWEPLEGTSSFMVEPGSTIRLETPGGGAWGEK